MANLKSMKLLKAGQMKSWDQFTIDHEPISSIDLMDRAAAACLNALLAKAEQIQLFQQPIWVFCGPGNNGGDGLALARLFSDLGCRVEVCIVDIGSAFSTDCKIQEDRLKKKGHVPIHYIREGVSLPDFTDEIICLDALLGTGLNREMNGLMAQVVQWMNLTPGLTISIDIPSGLFPEVYDQDIFHDLIAVEADWTLTFQQPKRSFLHNECYRYTGRFQVLDIGLHTDFLADIESTYFWIDEQFIRSMIHLPEKFQHKGNRGHALMVGGAFGTMGAIAMAAEAVLRAGAGLVTCSIPRSGYPILQSVLPEAMVICDDDALNLTQTPSIQKYDAIGIGPGMGQHPQTAIMLFSLLKNVHQPIVLDADALNGIAEYMHRHPGFRFPQQTIITPHPKEFDRLTSPSSNSFERLRKMQLFCQKHHITGILKGAHTAVVSSDGRILFNSSGNEILATAGSGDVLCGIITSFLSQGYSCEQAACLGVYVHGKCGDQIRQSGRATLLAGEIAKQLPEVLYTLYSKKKQYLI